MNNQHMADLFYIFNRFLCDSGQFLLSFFYFGFFCWSNNNRRESIVQCLFFYTCGDVYRILEPGKDQIICLMSWSVKLQKRNKYFSFFHQLCFLSDWLTFLIFNILGVFFAAVITQLHKVSHLFFWFYKEMKTFLDPPFAPGFFPEGKKDGQVYTFFIGRKFTGSNQPGEHTPIFDVQTLFILKSFLPIFVFFEFLHLNNGKWRNAASRLHLGLFGLHWDHSIDSNGGVEAIFLCWRQHHHSPGDVWRAVEVLRLSEHWTNSV